MKFIKIVGIVIGLLVLMRVFSIVSQNPDPRPSQIPAAENVGNMKLPTPTKLDLRNARKAYAKEFDQNMLEHRIESTTAAEGADSTTLTITCALTSRVMANELGKNVDWKRVQELGFRKVRLTNGFDGDLREGFTWDVAKAAR